ncbi:MAG: translation initiation factor IF-2 subunit alpha [Candidatus Kariarchaeaceae archaeon]
MSTRRLPKRETLVLGTIDEIIDQGVYVMLDEYEDLKAYCHISEISGAWIRNIRNFVRVGQKIVARVIRVTRSGQIDISMKRVSQNLKRQKIQEWKRNNTAINLIKFAAEQIGAPADEVLAKVEGPMVKEHGSLYAGIERSLDLGMEVYAEMDLPENWAEILVKIASENISIPTITISGIFNIMSFESNGVELLREALIAGMEAIPEDEADVKVELLTVGSPKYRFSVEARDYQIAEEALESVSGKIKEIILSGDGNVAFERDH